MAKIPTGNFGNAPVPIARQAQENLSGAYAMGDAIQRLGAIGADVALRVQETQRLLAVNAASTEAAMGLEEFALGLQNDRDYFTQYDRYQHYVKETDKKYQERFKNDPTAYRAWKTEFGMMAFQKGIEVRSQSLKGQIDVQKGETRTQLSLLSELAIAGDQQQQELVRTKANLLIQQAYDNGVLTADEAAKARLDFQDDVASAEVRRDIMIDPEMAAEKLLMGSYRGLSAPQQMQWLQQANGAAEARLRRLNAEQDRLQRQIDREQREIEDVTSKEGDQLLAQGQLTAEWIQNNRNNLSPEDYRYFYRAISGDGGVTDPTIYSDLRLRASNGEDVRQEARAELQRGRLKLEDYDRLVSRSEKNAGAASVPNWYKRGEQYIKDSLRVSDLNPDPAAAQRLASAMDEWTEWADNNPNADAKTAQEAYKRITGEYALINFKETTLTKRMPRFAVGDRTNLDIESTMRRTVQAYQSGEITQDEFEQQARLLKEWEDALNRSKVPEQ